MRPARYSIPVYLAVFLSVSASTATAYQDIPDFLERYHKILRQAYVDSGADMEYARKSGAMFAPLSNGDGVKLYWPADTKIKKKKLLVILPDAKTNAWQEFRFWYPLVKDRDTALFIPQWEQSPMEALRTTPNTMYPVTIQPAFILGGYGEKSGILFSRGRLTMFAVGVAGLDRHVGSRYFDAVVLNDGIGNLEDSIVRQINDAPGGKVFGGLRWFFQCHTDCGSLDRLAPWILFHGGRVESLEKTDDPERLKRIMTVLLPEEVSPPIAVPAAPAQRGTRAPAVHPAQRPAVREKNNFADKVRCRCYSPLSP